MRFSPRLRYVALQLAHLALTKHPRLKDEPFYKLEELCPDLCQEDCISKYYSEKVLAQGQSSHLFGVVICILSEGRRDYTLQRIESRCGTEGGLYGPPSKRHLGVCAIYSEITACR